MSAGGETISYDAAIPHLVARVPALETLVRKSRDSYGELIPHIVVGEIAFLADEILAQRNEDLANRLFDAVEELAVGGDHLTRELVQMSFAENLGKGSSRREELIAHLGPATRELFDEIERFWAGG